MIFEYENNRQDYLLHCKYVHGAIYHKARESNLVASLTWGVLFLVGAFISYSENQMFLVFLFLTYAWLLFYSSFTFKTRYWRGIEKSLGYRKDVNIRLEVTESGLRECYGAIESIAPWSAIKSYSLFEDTLLFEVEPNHWGIMPRKSLKKDSSSMQELIELLKTKGIPEKVNWK